MTSSGVDPLQARDPWANADAAHGPSVTARQHTSGDPWTAWDQHRTERDQWHSRDQWHRTDRTWKPSHNRDQWHRWNPHGEANRGQDSPSWAEPSPPRPERSQALLTQRGVVTVIHDREIAKCYADKLCDAAISLMKAHASATSQIASQSLAGTGWRSRLVAKKTVRAEARSETRRDERPTSTKAESNLNFETEVASRVAATSVAIKAQVRSQLDGDPRHSSRDLVSKEHHFLATAARHGFLNTAPFEATPLAELKRQARGRYAMPTSTPPIVEIGAALASGSDGPFNTSGTWQPMKDCVPYVTAHEVSPPAPSTSATDILNEAGKLNKLQRAAATAHRRDKDLVPKYTEEEVLAKVIEDAKSICQANIAKLGDDEFSRARSRRIGLLEERARICAAQPDSAEHNEIKSLLMTIITETQEETDNNEAVVD